MPQLLQGPNQNLVWTGTDTIRQSNNLTSYDERGTRGPDFPDRKTAAFDSAFSILFTTLQISHILHTCKIRPKTGREGVGRGHASKRETQNPSVKARVCSPSPGPIRSARPPDTPPCVRFYFGHGDLFEAPLALLGLFEAARLLVGFDVPRVVVSHAVVVGAPGD